MIDILTLVEWTLYLICFAIGLAGVPAMIKLAHGVGPKFVWSITGTICFIIGAASAGRYAFVQLPHSFETLPVEKRPTKEFGNPHEFEKDTVWAIRPDLVDAPGATDGEWVPIKHADSRRERLGWAWAVVTWWPSRADLQDLTPDSETPDALAVPDGGSESYQVSVPKLWENRPRADGVTLMNAEQETKENEGSETSIPTKWFMILSFVSLFTGALFAFAASM